MDVTPLVREGLQIIQSYSKDGFKVSGQTFTQAVIVSPNDTNAWDGVQSFADLKTDDFNVLIDQKDRIDVLLIGTGKCMAFLPTEILNHLHENGLYPDTMDTGAACRTFNVLVAEGRRVFAALFVSA